MTARPGGYEGRKWETMKELVKNSRVCGYLEKMYRQLNIDYFSGELEECVITIQSTPKAYGHVTCSKVWKVKDINRYELNISADTLSRPIENVVSTMLHEMVHIYNLMHDIQDCSRGNTYHNKKFKEKAESVDLIINYDNRIGWSITSPSEKLIDYIITQGWTEIAMNRGGSIGISSPGTSTGTSSGSGTDGDGQKTKKPSSTRKYMCPHCKMSVRATKIVRIICADCNIMMQTEE